MTDAVFTVGRVQKLDYCKSMCVDVVVDLPVGRAVVRRRGEEALPVELSSRIVEEIVEVVEPVVALDLVVHESRGVAADARYSVVEDRRCELHRFDGEARARDLSLEEDLLRSIDASLRGEFDIAQHLQREEHTASFLALSLSFETHVYPRRWRVVIFADVVVENLREDDRREENLPVDAVVLIRGEYTGEYASTRDAECEPWKGCL